MPNTKQAKKRMRQDDKKRMLNRSRASAMKTAMRKVRDAAESGDAAGLKEALSDAYKRIDKAAKGNVIHKNTAARRKALVARQAAAGGS